MANVVRALQEKTRQRKVAYYGKNLWLFATEILGYSLLLKDFHNPICEWLMKHDDEPRIFWTAARGHYKTTIQIADLLRCIMLDPNKTHIWAHADGGQAYKAGEEIANHLQHNEVLRAMIPNIVPQKYDKNYFATDKYGIARFTVTRQQYQRAYTASFISTGKDITGMHIDGSFRADDIIGFETLQESTGLAKVKKWWQTTVNSVIMPGCTTRNTGTRYDREDLYGEWIKSKHWKTMVRAVRETDGKPDYAGKSVGVMTEEEIDVKQEEMGPMFGPQMMNDPSPQSEKPWNPSECEHYLTRADAAGPGRFIVLSDPAPATIGSGLNKSRERPDGKKDDWATCVIKVRRHGRKTEIILVDGVLSDEWDLDMGMEEIARLMGKWNTPYVGVEAVGNLAGIYTNALKRACRSAGVPRTGIPLKTSSKSNAKNLRFGALCARAAQEELYICESCPSAFVDKLLEQARNWRPIGTGKNGLRHDDCADVLSYSTDPGLDDYIPSSMSYTDELEEDFEADFEQSRSRYCNI